MKRDKILVCIKRPGEAAYVEPAFDNTLEAFQQAVGGYIETVTICEDLVLICNEEGRLRNLPENGWICGVHFVGTVLAVCTDSEGNFTGIPCASVPLMLRTLNAADRK